METLLVEFRQQPRGLCGPKRRRIHPRPRRFWLDPYVDLEKQIWSALLAEERQSRYDQLFADYTGDLDDVESVRSFLPAPYKEFAANHDELMKNLLTLSQARRLYTVTDIIIHKVCLGCLYDACGQQPHTTCPFGCLHDKTTCETCSQPV